MPLKINEEHNDRGFAIVLILSVMALLLAAMISLLGISSRNVAVSTAESLTPVASQFTDAAARQIIDDLLAEIRAGSVEPAPRTATPVFYPATPLSAVPCRSSAQRSGTVSPPNLVKQSSATNKFYDPTLTFNDQPAYPQASTYPPTQRCSAISTTSAPAISAARWNQPLMLPRAVPTSATDMTPATSGSMRFGGVQNQTWQWSPPDWVYLQADGTNPRTVSPGLAPAAANPLVARYAYQIYDIGGLLDANVAGYDPDPLVVGGTVACRKGSTGLADLTQIGLTPNQLKRLVGFRNPVTLASRDTPPHGHRYVNFLLNGKSNLGFIRVHGGTSNTTTNRAFTSRSHLAGFLRSIANNDVERAAVNNAMQSLTHFSRSLEQPSFKPGFYDPSKPGSTPLTPVFTRPSIVPPAGRMDDTLYSIRNAPIKSTSTTSEFLTTTNLRVVQKLAFEMALGNNRGGNDVWGTLDERGIKKGDTRAVQDVINPAFLELTVKTSFVRVDGSIAKVGEPLVKKRFPLERLGWVTQRGPSASLSKTDPLYNPEGTPKAIMDCMGLLWMQDSAGVWFWAYTHGKIGDLFTLEELLTADKATGRPREPDFFELLKAGIQAGSLGKSSVPWHRAGVSWDPATYIQCRDRVSSFQIFEIGANLIDQNDADHFPTIIRIPNPDPNLNPKPATDPARYSPPLFTARGVEDIPYFYRFHMRAIEDASDVPNIPLPAPGGGVEITDRLAQYAGGAFKCGTTVLLGFPELWNPHASDTSRPFDASAYPTVFRVVAASETPSDVIIAPRDSTDMGLATNPKLGNIPTFDASNSTWLSFVNAGIFDFSINTIGYFGFSNAPKTTSIFLQSVKFGTHNTSSSLPIVYSMSTKTWSWPFNDIKDSDLTSSKTTSLFWSNAPFSTSGTLVIGSKETNYFFAAAPLSNLPPLASDGYTPMEPKPNTWPASLFSTTFQPIPANSVSTLPVPGDFSAIYKIGTSPSTYYVWNSGTYSVLKYPLTPRISDLSLTHNYTVRPVALTYKDGGVVPDPFPAYLLYKRVLTDRQGITRSFVRTSIPGAPPGTSTTSAGDTSSKTFDIRGTELLFNVSSSMLFREPSPLCNVGLPEGSNFKAGPDNFFSVAPYRGAVVDSKGRKWVGMSLGEVPTNFILLSKIYKRDRTLKYNNAANPSAGMSWVPDVNDVPLDLFQNKLGEAYEGAQPPDAFRPLRYFQLPVTAAGVDETYFTLRLQFRDANGKWITYDERYLFYPQDWSDYVLQNATPVLDRDELFLETPSKPQNVDGSVSWKSNSRPLGWCFPVLTSYDPRTPRFGNPVRIAGQNYQSVYGTSSQRLQALNAGPGALSAPLISGNSQTDRKSSAYIDLPASLAPPMTLTPQLQVPAAWNSWFFTTGSNGTDFETAYNYAAGTKAADETGGAYWWAAGKNPRGEILFKKPTANSVDYGWYPRLYKPSPPAGSTPKTYYRSKTGLTPESTLPNFLQDPCGDPNVSSYPAYYADSLRMGLLSENIAPSVATPSDPNASYRQAYADPDDVIRRASGALASSGGYTKANEGLPLAQGSLSNTNRPMILNRPFRSVAEMGYAFRGMPWKNITFFLPETGDAALLDLFCLSNPPNHVTSALPDASSHPIVAGKVNLNTRQEPVLRAMLAGALKDELAPEELLGAPSEAVAAARALLDRTTGTKPWQGPLTNISELAGKLFAKDLAGIPSTAPVYTSTAYRTGTEPKRNSDIQDSKDQVTWHFTGFSADLESVFITAKDRKIQRLRESAIRALVDGGQTRVWNLMLDVFVQTGVLAPNAASLSAFRKSGEKRLWVYLAIDRLTGQILERQNEWVSE